MVLGSSGVFKSFLIRHVLTRLSGVADQLWQVFQVTPPSPPSLSSVMSSPSVCPPLLLPDKVNCFCLSALFWSLRCEKSFIWLIRNEMLVLMVAQVGSWRVCGRRTSSSPSPSITDLFTRACVSSTPQSSQEAPGV